MFNAARGVYTYCGATSLFCRRENKKVKLSADVFPVRDRNAENVTIIINNDRREKVLARRTCTYNRCI